MLVYTGEGELQVTQKLLEPYWNQWRLDTDFLVTRLPLVAQHREQPQLVALTLERWLLELKACLSSLILGRA